MGKVSIENYVQKINSKWNIIDDFFLNMDKLLNQIRESNTEPDVEVMIETETQHLKEENELLKMLQQPRRMSRKDRNYICPNKRCGMEISGTLVEQYKIKFCPECGQRIFYNNTEKNPPA